MILMTEAPPITHKREAPPGLEPGGEGGPPQARPQGPHTGTKRSLF